MRMHKVAMQCHLLSQLNLMNISFSTEVEIEAKRIKSILSFDL